MMAVFVVIAIFNKNKNIRSFWHTPKYRNCKHCGKAYKYESYKIYKLLENNFKNCAENIGQNNISRD